MADVHGYPKLRRVESILLHDPTHGRMVMLRDTEGIAPSSVTVPASLLVVLARLDGTRSVAQIAASATRTMGEPVSEQLVATLAAELDAAYMLETARFLDRKRKLIEAFAASDVRPASHAGGAYPGEASELRRYIEDQCLAKATVVLRPGRLVGICAPHMDLWRAPEAYGYAYKALTHARLDEIDTFVLLGTSHAPMRRPFALCEKTFDTPLGPLAPDRTLCAELASASRFDVRAEEYLHKQEHSLELQAVFLRYLLGARQATIVPILCGLADAQERRRDPCHDADAESFLTELFASCRRREGRVLVVAGADLAHVGPRFGDASSLGERGREELASRDAASLSFAVGVDAPAFFGHVAEDLASRRVCGLGPIYTMLRALPPHARGEILHYAQHVDPTEGSIVSYASLGFYADTEPC